MIGRLQGTTRVLFLIRLVFNVIPGVSGLLTSSEVGVRRSCSHVLFVGPLKTAPCHILMVMLFLKNVSLSGPSSLFVTLSASDSK